MSGLAEENVRRLEDRRCSAMIDADVDTLNNLLSDELVWTHSAGYTDDKTALLKRIGSKTTQYIAINRLGEKYFVNSNTGVATGIAHMDVKIDGAPRSMRSRYLNVWLKEGDTWRLVAWQSTPVPVSADVKSR